MADTTDNTSDGEAAAIAAAAGAALPALIELALYLAKLAGNQKVDSEMIRKAEVEARTKAAAVMDLLSPSHREAREAAEAELAKP